MTIPAYKFQDPANHVKFCRETDCRGCKHLEYVFDLKMCQLKPMIRHDNLRKCTKYQENDE